MDGVNVGIFEEIVEIGVTFLDAERVADVIQLFLRALANGVHVGVGMLLINGDEFGPEPQPNDGDVNLTLAHDDTGRSLRAVQNPLFTSVMRAIEQRRASGVN